MLLNHKINKAILEYAKSLKKRIETETKELKRLEQLDDKITGVLNDRITEVFGKIEQRVEDHKQRLDTQSKRISREYSSLVNAISRLEKQVDPNNPLVTEKLNRLDNNGNVLRAAIEAMEENHLPRIEQLETETKELKRVQEVITNHKLIGIINSYHEQQERIEQLENGRTKDMKRLDFCVGSIEIIGPRIEALETELNKPSKLGNMLYENVLDLEKWWDGMIYADDTDWSGAFPDEMVERLKQHPGYYVIGQCKDCKYSNAKCNFCLNWLSRNKDISSNYGCIHWETK